MHSREICSCVAASQLHGSSDFTAGPMRQSGEDYGEDKNCCHSIVGPLEQLGGELFRRISTEVDGQEGKYSSWETRDLFFREASSSSNPRYVARAVLVDMEPKVVAQTLASAKAQRSWWSYSPACTLAEQSGSGNNWGRGYAHYGPAHREAACELVRREVEAADQLGGFLLTQSVAGERGPA